MELAQAVQGQQLGDGQVQIGVDDEVRLDDLGDLLLLDAPRGVVGGAVLGDGGVVERLRVRER